MGCQITWSKYMLCNILEYCSQTLDIHEQMILQFISSLFMTSWLLGIYAIYFCSRRAYNIENMVNIKTFINFIMHQFFLLQIQNMVTSLLSFLILQIFAIIKNSKTWISLNHIVTNLMELEGNPTEDLDIKTYLMY